MTNVNQPQSHSEIVWNQCVEPCKIGLQAINFICRNRWTSADSVITYNTVEVLGGVGSLVTGTGVYTAQAAGLIVR